MKQFLITMAGVFAGLLVFVIGVPLVLVSLAMSAAAPPPLPAASVLVLDLRDPLTDQDPSSPLFGLGGRSDSVMSIISNLRRAERDDKVKGLFVRLPEGGIEPGMADEIRLAFKHFRAAGKPIYAHSQGLYPGGFVSATYMLGASADQFWIQPGASLQVTGAATEDLFFKRLFDKYGIVPQFEQRKEYKTAVNSYLNSDYTAAHKQSTLSWMGSIYDSNLGFASADRKVDVARLRLALEAGPYVAEDALKLKLVDKLGQVREAEAALLAQAGAGAKTVDFHDYAEAGHDKVFKTGDTIAVIEAEGAIVTGRNNGANPFTGGSGIYADDLAHAILMAAKTDAVKAIVLRVNSPGGSDTASEQILDAIRVAKANNKPVVISMGTYAASGGYWISSGASAIVAQPTTLTGSIGVFGGKFAVGPALARFGVDIRQTRVGGEYAGAFGVAEPFSETQRAAFAGWMDRIYDNFIARVAVGRNLPPERVREIAKGRVWTGAQAKALGLVDELGGFYQAVDKAKALAGLTGEIQLRRMTPSEDTFQMLERALGVSAQSAKTLAAAAWIFSDPRSQAVLDKLSETGLRSEGSGMVLAPMSVR